MTASRRLLMTTAALLGLGLLAGLWRALGGPWADALGLPLWSLTLAVGVLASIDAALLARLPAISVRRDLPARLRAGETRTVELSLRHAGRRPLKVQVHDPLPLGMATQPLPQVVIIPPGQTVPVRYPLSALRRGRWTLGQCVIGLTSPLGLWRQRRHGATAQPVDVHPALLDGLPPSPAGEARDPGWPLILVVDASHDTAHAEGQPEAFERLLAAGLRLGQVALGQGDAVGLLTLAAGSIQYLPPGKGPAQLRALLDTLQAVEPSGHPAACRAVAETLLRRQHRRARVVWLRGASDQDHEPLLAAIAALRRHHQVLLASLGDEAIDAVRQQPVERIEQALAYCDAMRHSAARATLQARTTALGATWLDTSSAQADGQLVARYLAWKRTGGE